jgi:NADH-quinone oxidoreductase subunit J
MEILHNIFLLILIISSFLVFFSENAVHSVLFLILVFCIAAAILIIFGVEFLGLLFIIIYVGAIAVLFLFVIMMLNIKLYSFVKLSNLPIFFLSFCIILIELFFLFKDLFNSITLDTLNFFEFSSLIDSLSNIHIFGQVLYNYYLICFLLAGLLLLIAMIGAIVLTLNFKIKKKEIIFRQLSRSDNFLSFFK